MSSSVCVLATGSLTSSSLATARTPWTRLPGQTVSRLLVRSPTFCPGSEAAGTVTTPGDELRGSALAPLAETQIAREGRPPAERVRFRPGDSDRPLRAVLKSLPATRRPWLFTAGASRKFPSGDHHINVKRLSEQFARLVARLGMPADRAAGFVVHSLRHFFEALTVNAGIPRG